MIPTSSQQPRQIPGGPHPYTNAYFIVAPPQNACQEIPVSLDCYSFARSGQVYQLPRSASLRPNESMAANLESHQVLTSCHLDRECKAWYVVDSLGQPGRPVQMFRTPVENNIQQGAILRWTTMPLCLADRPLIFAESPRLFKDN